MTHEMHNGEHTEDWPAADRPISGDDSDAPVSMDEPATEASDNNADAASDSPGESDRVSDGGSNSESGGGSNGGSSDDSDDDAEALMAEIDNDESSADVHGADNVEIKNGGARDIDATNVSITQGGARDIEATTVTINQGGAARISADELTISQGGVGIARTEHLTIQEGGNAFAVLADKATLDPETSVFLLIAGSTSGDVRPVLDWRSAAAFGAGFALVMGLLRRLRR